MLSGILNNIALLVILSFIYSQIYRISAKNTFRIELLHGLVFGVLTVAAMLAPIRVSPGVIIDTRSIIISISGLIGGPVTAAVTVVVASVYRISIGGIGTFPSLVMHPADALLGVLFYIYYKRHQKTPGLINLYIFGVACQLIGIPCTMLLPYDIAIKVLKNISPYMITIFPFVSMLVGKMLYDQKGHLDTEKALRASEERLRTLFEQSNDAIFIHKAGKIIDVNKKACGMLGYSRDELLELRTTDLNVQDEKSKSATRIENVLKGEPVVFETRFKKATGEIIDVEVSSNYVDKERKIIQGIARDITDRKLSERALHASEKFLDRLIDQSPFATWISDEKGTLQRANPALKRFLNLTDEQLVGKYNVLLDPLVESQGLLPLIRTVFEEGKSINFSCDWNGNDIPTMDLKGSKSISIEATMFPILNSENKLTNVVLNWIDITKRKQAEQALKDSLQTSADIVSSIPSGLFIYQFEEPDRLVLIEGNAEAEQMTGINSQKWIGREFNEIWPQAYESGVTDAYLKVIKTGETYEAEDLQYKDARLEGAFKIRAFPMPGKRLGVAFENITEKKQSENALRTIMESTAGLVGDQFFNNLVAKLCQWLGCDVVLVGELEGNQIVRSIVMKVDEKIIYDYSYILKGTPCEDVTRDGYCIFPERVQDLFPEDKDLVELGAEGYIGTPLKDRQGKAIGILNALSRKKLTLPEGTEEVMDIIAARASAEIERRRLETQLLQAQKLESIGTLAGGIAHDFNNILSPIMIHSELAMGDLPPDSPLQFNLKEILAAGGRARDLVKQILTFSRKDETVLTKIRVKPILKETLKMLRSTTPTTINIIPKIETDNDVIYNDPTQIQQIIMNLCTNAVHAMREQGGTLEVGLDECLINYDNQQTFPDLKPGAYLRLSVRDNGNGIDKETINNIFEPYFTTKKTGEGTGLGLATVHGIIKNSKGDISVESEIGIGTRFEVLLPRIEFEADIKKVERKPVLPKGSEKILFVDDEASAVDANRAMLETLGYQVTARTSSIEALEAFRNNPLEFDLVITDMTMPNMTGKDLAKELITIRPDIPIIMCTGFSELIDEESARETGIKALIMKPIVMHEMANKIREVLNEKS